MSVTHRRAGLVLADLSAMEIGHAYKRYLFQLRILAAVLGALLATVPFLDLNTAVASLDAAAVVNGEVIGLDEYTRAMVALARDKSTPVRVTDRERILERLIEEELLVQRAVEIGLVSRDRKVRAALVDTMLVQIMAGEDESPQVSEESMRAWYAENTDLFRTPPQFLVRRVGDAGMVQLPNTLIPLPKLKDYVGAATAEAIAAAEPGSLVTPDGVTTDRVEETSGYVLVRRVNGTAPTFEAAREQIRTAMQREQAGAKFREYLSWLKARASIERNVQ